MHAAFCSFNITGTRIFYIVFTFALQILPFTIKRVIIFLAFLDSFNDLHLQFHIVMIIMFTFLLKVRLWCYNV